MARLRARHHGTRYALRPSSPLIGRCLEDGCPGTLRVAALNETLLIACNLCPVQWPQRRWLELAELLEGQPE